MEQRLNNCYASQIVGDVIGSSPMGTDLGQFSFPLRLCNLRIDAIMIGVEHGHSPPSHCGIHYIQMLARCEGTVEVLPLMFIGNPFMRECQNLRHKLHWYICKIFQ